MDGFTGFNDAKCRQDLEKFGNACNSVYIYGGKAVQTFNLALVENWASPKAAGEVNSSLKESISVIGDLINTMCNRIALNAAGAIRYLAIKNGTTFEYADSISLGGNLFYQHAWVNLNESSIHGVGMNKERVKNVILPDFLNAMDELVNKLDEIPLDLAVYDPSNAMADTYRNLINVCKQEIQNEVNLIKNNVQTLMEGEIDSITIGVNNATQALAG